MKRIEINCAGIKNAEGQILKAGWNILRHPNHPRAIHIAADKITIEQAQDLAILFGRASYQEIDNGKRTVKKASRLKLATSLVRSPKPVLVGQWVDLPRWAKVAAPVAVAATSALAVLGLHLAGAL